ncbi:MAG TPA: peptidylprolyl isomerase [Candidatus Limnocylindrales bacterium]|jgi:parvulin-like peptidyl-prolyl isomerase|nr:peptidylprolyl isomerase [Candidatus Limnocylindrales bacterium]
MTFRVRPVDRGRAERDPNRRTLYMNIGFGIAVVAAVLILVTVGATTWYGEHLAAAATIDGQTINKDQFADRAKVEQFRLQQLANRVQSELAAGRLTSAQAKNRIDSINGQLDQSTFISSVLEKLIDTQVQGKLAAAEGVTVADAQVDQRILDDKTRKEERHVWVIAVTPTVDTGKTDPTAVQKAAAKKAADDALAQIKGGKAFEDVAKAVSTDASKTSGGDLGWIDATSSEDPAWQAAMFKLAANGVSDVILGEDGTYRIGRVTEIAPAEVDQAWDQKLADAKVSQESYRAAIRSEAIRQGLEDKIVAADSASGPQRHVEQLSIKTSTTTGSKAIKVRHILYSPKDDAQGAANVPATDPSWTQAQLGAQAAYDKLQKDPSQFDAIARAESDEASAKGDDGTGGKLPYFDETSEANGLDPDFAKAILADGLQPGQILAPFNSAFGWHVVQVMYRPPDSDEIAKLKAQAAAGTPFTDLARDFSEGPKSGKGGDLGWVTKGQLDDRLTAAIFAAPANGLSEIVDLPNDGLYLFKVLEEKTATPDKDQLATIKANAFQNWYAGKKDAVKITRDLLGPSATTTTG